MFCYFHNPLNDYLFYVYLVKLSKYFKYAGFLGVEIYEFSASVIYINKAAEFAASIYRIGNF